MTKQQVCVCRLHLITWFMLVMISICSADGEAGDNVNQANQPRSETGALTPEEEDVEDKSQVDTCPPPFTVWFGGTARLCLLLACACCIFVQHPGQLSDFSMQAAVQSLRHVFCRALVYGTKCEMPQVESNKQDNRCFGQRLIHESYSTLLPNLCLLSCLRQTLWNAQLALNSCLAVCRCYFTGVVVSGPAVSVTS